MHPVNIIIKDTTFLSSYSLVFKLASYAPKIYFFRILFRNSLANQLTLQNRALLEKPKDAHLDKKSSLLGNWKFHYHVQKNLLLASILSQMKLVHTLTSCFLKIHLNIILPSMLSRSNCNSINRHEI